MKSEYTLLFACLMALFRCSRVISLEDHSSREEDRQEPANDSHSRMEEDAEKNDSSSRWNHARMRDFPPSTTTPGYDDWWFLTTARRPFLSYRDFPGRPGVATWKEISPGADKNKGQKVSTPTAAEVSSRAPDIVCSGAYQTTVALVLLVIMHRCFGWT